jgi:hypothetical protein
VQEEDEDRAITQTCLDTAAMTLLVATGSAALRVHHDCVLAVPKRGPPAEVTSALCARILCYLRWQDAELKAGNIPRLDDSLWRKRKTVPGIISREPGGSVSAGRGGFATTIVQSY